MVSGKEKMGGKKKSFQKKKGHKEKKHHTLDGLSWRVTLYLLGGRRSVFLGGKKKTFGGTMKKSGKHMGTFC